MTSVKIKYVPSRKQLSDIALTDVRANCSLVRLLRE